MALWVRFEQDGAERFGTLSDGAGEGEAGRIRVHDGGMFTDPVPTEAVVPREAVRLLPPVRPGKFIGLWNNFHELAAKLGTPAPETPLFFLKATTSLLPPDGTIRPPRSYGGKVVYEGELGIVVGRACRDVSEAEARDTIFGYTCVNDVTAMDLLHADPAFPQWARAKGCDTFGPCGPAVATGLDWRALRIRTLLNGRERQNYPAADMILPPERIVAAISREMTLEPGDLIACGTSVGVLPMRAGATVEVHIDGIGTLRNPVGDAA